MRDIERYTKNYLNPGFEDYQVEYRRKKIIEILNSYKPKQVLEIGCGMEPLFKYIEWKYDLWTVVEPSKVFYENAKNVTKKLKQGKCIRIFNEIFPTLSIKGMKFDFIICSSLLHEVERSEEFLREMVSACSKNTIIHINVPNANSLHRVLAKYIGMIDDVHAYSVRNKQFQQSKVYDLELLKGEAVKAGLVVCDAGSYFIKPFTHSQMYKMIEHNIIGKDVLEGLYAMSKEFEGYGSEIYINARLAD